MQPRPASPAPLRKHSAAALAIPLPPTSKTRLPCRQCPPPTHGRQTSRGSPLPPWPSMHRTFPPGLHIVAHCRGRGRRRRRHHRGHHARVALARAALIWTVLRNSCGRSTLRFCWTCCRASSTACKSCRAGRGGEGRGGGRQSRQLPPLHHPPSCSWSPAHGASCWLMPACPPSRRPVQRGGKGHAWCKEAAGGSKVRSACVSGGPAVGGTQHARSRQHYYSGLPARSSFAVVPTYGIVLPAPTPSTPHTARPARRRRTTTRSAAQRSAARRQHAPPTCGVRKMYW